MPHLVILFLLEFEGMLKMYFRISKVVRLAPLSNGLSQEEADILFRTKKRAKNGGVGDTTEDTTIEAETSDGGKRKKSFLETLYGLPRYR